LLTAKVVDDRLLIRSSDTRYSTPGIFDSFAAQVREAIVRALFVDLLVVGFVPNAGFRKEARLGREWQ
jgi:hypothetical protein